MTDTAPFEMAPHLIHKVPTAPVPASDQACIAEFFTMGRRLGDGGMSETRLARQDTIGRNVVVKSATNPNEATALVGEARIIARLYHPGVVPLLGLGHDERGRPAMIMPLVEGRMWRSFVSDEGELSVPTICDKEPLEWHLDVLLRVARVLEHAHERRIIHRDVKPGNVMIGHNGEVLLIDWGLGVTTDRNEPDLPRACDIDRFVGTTGHAAPEMVDTRRPLIGTHTDIYQLGTCLHVVLTGRPPHDAAKMEGRLRSILRSEPKDYSPETPPSLAAICHRAMARNPADRFRSMTQMRRAIEAAIQQLASNRTARDGLGRLVALRRAIAGTPDAEYIAELFAECRFVFRGALESWPENPVALDGLQSAIETVVHYDLMRGRIARAGRLLAELPRPRPDLEARLTESDNSLQIPGGGPRLMRFRRLGQGVEAGS